MSKRKAHAAIVGKNLELTLAQKKAYPRLMPFFARLEGRYRTLKNWEEAQALSNKRQRYLQQTISDLFIQKSEALIVLMVEEEYNAVANLFKLLNKDAKPQDKITREFVAEMIHQFGEDVQKYGLSAIKGALDIKELTHCFNDGKEQIKMLKLVPSN